MLTTLERRPVTERMLRRDLAELGIEPGTTLVVHSSLGAIGWVVGGAPTVVRALLHAVGDEGTLAMPAATPHCADPATWREPRIPEPWLDEVRESLPPFDVSTTPTAMGAVPEAFRTWPGTLRSEHPLESVCARGPRAEEITRDHPIAFSEGPGSPFARLHDLDCRILLLGVGFNRCTGLHFAESLVARRRTMTVRFPRLDGARREWVAVPNVADDHDTHFPVIGAQYLAAKRATEGKVGEATATSECSAPRQASATPPSARGSLPATRRPSGSRRMTWPRPKSPRPGRPHRRAHRDRAHAARPRSRRGSLPPGSPSRCREAESIRDSARAAVVELTAEHMEAIEKAFPRS